MGTALHDVTVVLWPVLPGAATAGVRGRAVAEPVARHLLVFWLCVEQ